MIYKDISIEQAIFSRIDEDVAKEYVDYRRMIKKPLTQNAFNRAVKAAVRCETELGVSANEAFEITLDKGWQGVTFEYIANNLKSRQQAMTDATAVKAIDTRSASIHENLNDHSWANTGNVTPISTRNTPLAHDLKSTEW